MARKRLARAVLFFVLLALVLLMVQNVVSGTDSRMRQWIGGFYEEPKDSLDAVFIGSSATYAFWNAPYAWNKYGLTVFPLASNGQPFEAAEFLIKEARKSQPNALFIVQIRSINTLTETKLHYLTDYLPFSMNKIELVNTLGDYLGMDPMKKAEYLLPMIRFHSRWNELGEVDFYNPLDGYKGACYYASYLHNSTDVTSSFRTTSHTGILPENTQTALDRLLAYCDQEQINVLFILTPHTETDEYYLAQINTVKEVLEARGYPVLNLLSMVDEVGLDLTTDFYNEGHTNLNGSLKVTDFICSFLLEHYDFTDKRGNPAYQSWDEAYASYSADYALINVIPDIWEGGLRDMSLSAPKVKVTADGSAITVSWDHVTLADGYSVYRRVASNKYTPENAHLRWEKLATVQTGEPLTYVDEETTLLATYYYTVVPFREEDGVRYWGKHIYYGTSVQSGLDYAHMLPLEGSVNNLTLTWTPVEQADGYLIYRKLPGKTFITIADIQDPTVTTYTDTAMFEGVPYIYAARPYSLDLDGVSKLRFEYDRNGILWMPEISDLPQVSITLEGGVPYLTWEQVEGMMGYNVYRRTSESETWEQVGKTLAADATSIQDTTATDGTQYTYRVEAYVTGYPNGTLDGQEKVTYTFELPCDQWIEADRPDTPRLLSVEGAENGLTLRWSAVEGADGYRVYRKLPGAKGWDQIAELPKDDVTAYTDTDTLPDVPYSYTVRAFTVTLNGQNVMTSDYDRGGILWMPELSDLPQVTVALAGGVPYLTWEPLEGMTGYTIYRRSSEDEEWQQVGDLSPDASSMQDLTAQRGTTYAYRVVACVSGYSNGSLDGQEAELHTFELPCDQWIEATRLDTPRLLSLEGADNDLTIRWSAVDSADGYRVYRKLPGTKGWDLIAELPTNDVTAYTVTDILPGVPYNYTVRAYAATVDKKNEITSDYDHGGILWIPKFADPLRLSVELVNGVPYLTWEPLEGMTEYTIHRRTSEDEEWQQIRSVPSSGTCSMQDTAVQANTQYMYRVEAHVAGYPYGSLDGQAKETYSFELSCDEWFTPVLPGTPVLLSLEGTEYGLTIRWSAIEGVDGYLVYRKFPGDNGWEQVSDIIDGYTTAFTDTDVSTDTTCRYTVRAYVIALDDQTKVRSGYNSAGIRWEPEKH